MKFLPNTVRDFKRAQIVLFACSALMLVAHMLAAVTLQLPAHYIAASVWAGSAITNGWFVRRHRDL